MTLNEEQRQELVIRIERVGNTAVDRLLDEINQNPFWAARFGENGLKHPRLDTNYHIKQLASAIALNMPSLAVNYYHWLQGLLVYRGMCTLHIQESIDGLAHQLSRLLPDDWPEIEPYLRAGETGLVYEHPASLALAECQSSIAAGITERIFTHPRVRGQINQQAKLACLRDNRYYLSYLCDSVAISKTAFEAYIAWLSGSLPNYGMVPADLFENLELLCKEIHSALPTELAEPFEDILQRTLQQNIFASMQKNRRLQ